MIRIASPQRIELNAQAINGLQTDTERRNYVLDNNSFFVTDTRLGNIELQITFEAGVKPRGLLLYFFQQIAKSQIQPRDLTFEGSNQIRIRIPEADFFRNNPLYVDRIGVLASNIIQDCRITVEAFKIL